MNNIYEYEKNAYEHGYHNIAGTDEVGRGPMAGPLVAAAVILPEGLEIPGINDSKKLSPKKREELYQIIKEKAIEVTVTFIDVEEVDRLNVYQASKLAMTKCIQKMKHKVDYILTDAMNLDLDIPYLSLIKGDAKSASIAAASIIAKVERDRYMVEIDAKYPQYGFKKHKGYVTKAHLEAIKKYGVTEMHRKSFAPVQEILNH
jgi:ribonuclease HII